MSNLGILKQGLTKVPYVNNFNPCFSQTWFIPCNGRLSMIENYTRERESVLVPKNRSHITSGRKVRFSPEERHYDNAVRDVWYVMMRQAPHPHTYAHTLSTSLFQNIMHNSPHENLLMVLVFVVGRGYQTNQLPTT